VTLLAAGTSSDVLVELGVVLLALAVVGRVAGRVGLPTIPLFVLVGIGVGDGGAALLDASRGFVRIGADLGVVLLLLLLGLEYDADDLRAGLRSNGVAGGLDLVANFTPGLVAGLLLGWGALGGFLLGGITYVSSSGIIAKLLGDLERYANRETPVVLAVLVFEDLAMAVFLPVAAAWLLDTSAVDAVTSVGIAIAVVVGALFVSFRYGVHVSRLVETRNDEMLVFTVLGLTFLAAGAAEALQVSAAVGAFLLGVGLSGRVAETGRELLVPVRDVFAGLFFVSFGSQIEPERLLDAVGPALALALVTAATKAAVGWDAARRAGIGRRGRRRAAASLVPRGEFSIVIAGLGVAGGIDAELGSLTALYVLSLAIAGSLATRWVDRWPEPGRRAVSRAGAGRRGTPSPGS
jgi:monovalent cation:H+ antiporter-2, CPA2 family